MNPVSPFVLIIPLLGLFSLVAMLFLAWRCRDARAIYVVTFCFTILIAGLLATNKSQIVGEEAFSLFTAFNILVDYSFIGCLTLLIASVVVALQGTRAKSGV
jgi:hypothetical protein